MNSNLETIEAYLISGQSHYSFLYCLLSSIGILTIFLSVLYGKRLKRKFTWLLTIIGIVSMLSSEHFLIDASALSAFKSIFLKEWTITVDGKTITANTSKSHPSIYIDEVSHTLNIYTTDSIDNTH